ncbi:MFS transporter [Pararoseomonas indoligenes]|uniref:MFS transporter n=1 Tax=Roseomonas indoligenes TaxID=2820811 RepID=A0A940MZA8_9PROT|nr:MFS transporter [Pararoseomonas indoligenes]MBP0491437.1 MFS transporter [Pararoseomonas indoligenes]
MQNPVRRLALSNLSAQASEQVALSAAPLLAVLSFGAGAEATGWLQAAQTLPFLLLALPADLLADRTSRLHLMIGAEAIRAAALLAILVLAGTGHLGIAGLAALGALGAGGTVAQGVAAPAIVPALVPRAALASANRALELGRSLAFMAGPALGGALIGWLGAGPAYGLAIGLSLLAVAPLAGLTEPPRPAPARRNLAGELREGVGFVLSHPLLRPILVTAVLFNAAWFLLQAALVVHAVRNLGLSATGVGTVLALFGAGMVAGALASPLLAARARLGALIAAGPLVALLASLLMLATAALPSPALAGAALFLFGAGPVLWTIHTTALRQAVTPGAMLGRVSATVMTATYGARPLGAALGALLAARWGVEACLLASSLGFAAQAAVILVSPAPGLREMPAASAASPA